jgi:hypothetical protein
MITKRCAGLHRFLASGSSSQHELPLPLAGGIGESVGRALASLGRCLCALLAWNSWRQIWPLTGSPVPIAAGRCGAGVSDASGRCGCCAPFARCGPGGRSAVRAELSALRLHATASFPRPSRNSSPGDAGRYLRGQHVSVAQAHRLTPAVEGTLRRSQGNLDCNDINVTFASRLPSRICMRRSGHSGSLTVAALYLGTITW